MSEPGDLLLRDVRPWPRSPDEPSGDLLIRNGVIAALGASDPPADVVEVDGRGGIVLPSFTDAHAHLDSTRLGLPFRQHTAGPGLAGLVENDRVNWRTAGASVADRATYTLGRTIAAGATLVRSHAQVDTDSGLERLEGVLEARRRHADRARVEVVAFPQAGVVRDPGTADLLDRALAGGADLVGGIDPCSFDRDPVSQLDVVFGLAERHGRGADIHLHETGELGAFTLELICERVRRHGMEGRVTISHCFALPGAEPATTDRLIGLLAEHDIAVTTVAPGNREPLPLPELRRAGVRVGLGQDGIRDYWSPYGNGDMLERAWMLAHRAGYRRDETIEACVEVATLGGRGVVDGSIPSRSGRGLDVGAPADLVVVPGDTVTAAVMDRRPRTLVIRSGRVVARDGELV